MDNYATHKTEAAGSPNARAGMSTTPRRPPCGQVERFFGLLTEKQLRRGVHQSTADLERATINDNPKPFRRTGGRNSDSTVLPANAGNRPGSGHKCTNFGIRTLVQLFPSRRYQRSGLLSPVVDAETFVPCHFLSASHPAGTPRVAPSACRQVREDHSEDQLWNENKYPVVPGSARQIRRGLGYGPNAGDRLRSWSGQAIREAPEERCGTLAEAVSRPAIRRREERGTAVARNDVVCVRLGLCANALGQRLAATKFGLAGQGARYGRCPSGARGRVAGDDWNGRRERQR